MEKTSKLVKYLQITLYQHKELLQMFISITFMAFGRYTYQEQRTVKSTVG